MQQFPCHTADEQPSVFTNGSNAVMNTAESAQTAHNNARDEIAALANELEDFNTNRIAPYGRITEIVAKMRQLSPVA